jgi:nuclear pore complex protein Nup53
MQGVSESMLLGSPSSPTQQQSPFLPAYLMGDTSVIASPASRPWSSPPRSQLNRSLSTGPISNSPSFVCNTSRTRDNRFKDRPSAPPVHGLIESVSGAGPSATHSRLEDSNQSGLFGMSGASATPNYRLRTVPGYTQSPGGPLFNQSYSVISSPAQLDPFYSQGESLGLDYQLDETWVTVFGFPPAATSYILQEFSQYGNIIKHVIAADGNWLHLHYQSKIQAKKALSKNGKVFGGSIMIGVALCIDKSVMGSGDKENTAAASFLQTSLQSPGCPDDCRMRVPGKLTSLRSLTGSFRVANSETEVVQQNAVPLRSSGIISKAMEYMFGW